MTQELQLTIHIDTYLGKFQQELATHLANLRGTLRGIEDGSLLDKAKSGRPGAVIHFDLGSASLSADDAIPATCNRCFLDVTRSLISYLDRVITARRCRGTKMKVPVGSRSQAELKQFYENYLEVRYQEVAKDTKLTNPKKIQELAHLRVYERDALLSYFQLRRCLEHHGSVASADITVHYTRLVISAAGDEIKTLPYHAPENTSIDAHFARETLVFRKGTKVTLTEGDLENICLTLQLLIGPSIIEMPAAPISMQAASRPSGQPKKRR